MYRCVFCVCACVSSSGLVYVTNINRYKDYESLTFFPSIDKPHAPYEGLG